MTLVISDPKSDLEPFKMYFGGVLIQNQRLCSRISGGENVGEDLFPLSAYVYHTLASHKSSIKVISRTCLSSALYIELRTGYYNTLAFFSRLRQFSVFGQNLLNFAVSKTRKQLIEQVSCLPRDFKKNGNSCFYVEIQDTYASFVGFKYSYKNILNSFSFFLLFCCVRFTILNLTANILDYIKEKEKKKKRTYGHLRKSSNSFFRRYDKTYLNVLV